MAIAGFKTIEAPAPAPLFDIDAAVGATVGFYGALDVIDLAPGEQVVIDSGHVVAYDLGMRFQLRQAAGGQIWKTIKSGEGFVFDFYGPGRVFLQSRNPAAFEAYIRGLVPTSNS